jgi:hypothetical protein
MGYTTHFYGELTIRPPLTHPEIKGSPMFGPGGGTGVRLVINEEHVDTEEGPLIRRTAAAVEICGDELRGDAIMHELRTLLKQHGRGAGHEIAGTLECIHEHPDIETPSRVVVDGAEVREVWPALVWPDDPETIGVLARYLNRHVKMTDAGWLGPHESNELATSLVRELVSERARR